MMKNVIAMGLLVLCLSLVGCSTNPVSQTTAASPYAGTWEFVVAGSIVGSTTSTIDTDGNFSFSVLVSSVNGSYTSIISGNVDSAGRVTGFSYYGSNKSATIRGNMINSSSASGTYTALTGYVGAGTWTMTRR